MEYKIAIHTDIGIKKQTNQDSCCVMEGLTEKGKVILAVICDGMGGLAKGEVASASLINIFSNWFEENLPKILAEEDVLNGVKYSWSRLIKEQNRSILKYGEERHIELGSTITALLILESGEFLISHVGDTRVYRITDNDIEVLTEDQTFVANEVKHGRLSLEEAEIDPRRNILLQCVGASGSVEPEFYTGKVERNECYMLCSDGFRHVVKAEEIQKVLAPANNSNENIMKGHIEELIDLNKFRHEVDNITAMLIKIV